MVSNVCQSIPISIEPCAVPEPINHFFCNYTFIWCESKIAHEISNYGFGIDKNENLFTIFGVYNIFGFFIRQRDGSCKDCKILKNGVDFQKSTLQEFLRDAAKASFEGRSNICQAFAEFFSVKV